MIELNDVTVVYSNGVRALNDVSLTINDGEFVFIVGESGAGKSTLIKLLIREIMASDGEVKVNGFDLNEIKQSNIPYLRRTIGFVFQDFKLINTMTVYDNVAFALRCMDVDRKYINKRVPAAIGAVYLSDKMKAYPSELSGGEQQRVALARALVTNPSIIIADEPTGNLDPTTSFDIIRILQDFNKKLGTTVLMVTHDHNNVKRFGGRLISLENGKISFDGRI